MSNPTRFGDELETLIETLDRKRRGRIHLVFRHNDDGTRTYWCGKTSSPRALNHGAPGVPRCQQCDTMWHLNRDLNATVHPSIRTTLSVLNALDRGEARK